MRALLSRRALFTVAAVLALCAVATAAGVVTTAEITHTRTKKLTFNWTSSAGGAADGTSTAAFDGKIIGLTTDPGAGPPTDNYDVAILDADGHDVLLGAGANRDTTVTEFVASASLGAVSGSKLTLAVTNAGATTVGQIVLYIQ